MKSLIFLSLCALWVPAAGPIGGFSMPTLQDERDTYLRFKKSWNVAQAEPHLAAAAGYSITNPDIHGETEGDDLWTNLMMYLRTRQQGYLDRANAWARYFKNDYRKCVGNGGATYCYDKNTFGNCHQYGWGLVALYEYNNDIAALTEAESLASQVETLWGPNTVFGCVQSGGCLWYGQRLLGRQLLLVTRVAEVTGKARWITLRDKILTTLMSSSQWNAQYGMYFYGPDNTQGILGAGAYEKGDRVLCPMEIGVLVEGMSHAWRVTGRVDIKNRIITMARFVQKYGLDSVYQYSSYHMGVVNGKPWQESSAKGVPTFWDPVYTTSFVNTLMWGYKFTGERKFYDDAFHFFDRGNKGIYGEPVKRSSPDSVINHFVDTRFFAQYFDFNKGELQYTYHMFENPDSAVIGVENKSGLALSGFKAGVEAYPNPFRERTVLHFSPGGALKIFDLKGRMIKDFSAAKGKSYGHDSYTWDAGGFPTGIYFAKVSLGNKILTQKLLLQK